MNLPLSWLKQFVNIKAKPQEIAEKLTLSGSEVEKIIDNSKVLKKVLVGKIKKIEPHPDADKLQIAYVDVGRKTDLKIVCGAPNIQKNQRVPTILVGGQVPGLKVEARKIRGIASQGMLASEKELGIGDDHSGIYILPNDAKIGEDVVKYLELDDPVLELDITPNRPDCFSIRGLAREVAALTGRKIQDTRHKLQEGGTPASSAINVKIEDKKLCPKYCARVIQGVTVGPSPLWLANKVRQAGIRSINNIVDVTNYVMYELGHPLHAFDANLLHGDSIIVRKAKKSEKIAALDEETYTLNPDMLIIADSKKAVAIAGVMGGMDTGVTKGTQNIILEAAVFDSASVRKTSKALNLRSESSSRFEKGIDWEVVEDAIDMATSIIQELAGGTVLKGIVSQESKTKDTKPIKLALSEFSRILGIDIKAQKIKSILESLGFEVSGKDTLNIRVPSWRVHDVFLDADLIEEVGRMLDYNTMPKTLPVTALTSQDLDPLHKLRHNLRHYLAGVGYTEILTYSFYNEASIKLSGAALSYHIKLTNPVNENYPYLRTSMMPWMISKMSQNSSLLSREQFQLFEIGKVFHRHGGEKWQVSIGLINTQAADEQLYRQLRGTLEKFVGGDLSVEKKGKQYYIASGKREIGQIHLYPKHSVQGMRFRSSVAIMLIDLEEIIKIIKPEQAVYKPIPYYPVVERDLGVVIKNVIQYKQISDAILRFNKLIKKVELFDVFHGLEDGSSLAFRLTFSSTDRTLESQEVDEVMEKLKISLEKKFKVSFR